MKNLLDYGLGCFPTKFELEAVYRNVENILDMEPAGSELRKEMLAAWREWKLANLKFGRLLRKQDERLFAAKK
jgi:hypothetical protein